MEAATTLLLEKQHRKVAKSLTLIGSTEMPILRNRAPESNTYRSRKDPVRSAEAPDEARTTAMKLSGSMQSHMRTDRSLSQPGSEVTEDCRLSPVMGRLSDPNPSTCPPNIVP